MSKRKRRGLGSPTTPDLCRAYIRARMRDMKPPAGYRLTMYTLKNPPKPSTMTATTCGQYGIGLMKK